MLFRPDQCASPSKHFPSEEIIIALAVGFKSLKWRVCVAASGPDCLLLLPRWASLSFGCSCTARRAISGWGNYSVCRVPRSQQHVSVVFPPQNLPIRYFFLRFKVQSREVKAMATGGTTSCPGFRARSPASDRGESDAIISLRQVGAVFRSRLSWVSEWMQWICICHLIQVISGCKRLVTDDLISVQFTWLCWVCTDPHFMFLNNYWLIILVVVGSYDFPQCRMLLLPSGTTAWRLISNTRKLVLRFTELWNHRHLCRVF